MAKFAIADAANRAGVERTTLYRKLNKGEISAEIDAHGNKVIDASELLRVYPNAKVLDGLQQLRRRCHLLKNYNRQQGKQHEGCCVKWRSAMRRSRI